MKIVVKWLASAASAKNRQEKVEAWTKIKLHQSVVLFCFFFAYFSKLTSTHNAKKHRNPHLLGITTKALKKQSNNRFCIVFLMFFIENQIVFHVFLWNHRKLLKYTKKIDIWRRNSNEFRWTPVNSGGKAKNHFFSHFSIKKHQKNMKIIQTWRRKMTRFRRQDRRNLPKSQKKT